MIFVCRVVDIFRNLSGDRQQFFPVSRIAEHFCTPVDQPGSLDIMAIRIQINQRIPCPVEEYFLTAFFFVIYFIREEIHHKAETVTGKRILCHAVQLGICFENMQQRIHGLLCHDTVLRELFIALRLEIAGKCLEITVLVGAVCLDDLLQRFCQLQRLGVARRIKIRRQRINCKCLIVRMLCRIERFSVVGDRPEHATVLAVHTRLFHKAVRMLRIGAQLLVL